MDCPYCHEWMPCKARTEMLQGGNSVTILSYTCDECGRGWENMEDGLGLKAVVNANLNQHIVVYFDSERFKKPMKPAIIHADVSLIPEYPLDLSILAQTSTTTTQSSSAA